MIARTWRGAVRTQDADAYVAYLDETGVAEYAATPGNRGVWTLRRDRDDDRTEIVMFTLWDSIGAVKAFAGEDHAIARFYPEDDRYLVEREERAEHYEVAAFAPPREGEGEADAIASAP